MAKGKGQVIGESVAGPISLVEYGPSLFFPVTAADVFPGNTGWSPDGGVDRKCVCKGGQPGKLRTGRHNVFLKGCDFVGFNVHLSKTLWLGRKPVDYFMMCRKTLYCTIQSKSSYRGRNIVRRAIFGRKMLYS